MAYKLQDGSVIDPGAFDVDYLRIVGDATVDVTYMMVELNIYESIFEKCITGSLILQDGINLITNIPVREGDIIEGKLKTLENDPFVAEFDPDGGIEFSFEIVKINKHEKTKQDVQFWGISFVSSTWSDNLSNRVSKSWKKTEYSTMVEEIYDDFLSFGGMKGDLPIKGIDVSTTEGLWNVVIPNWKPYDAITWLSRRSFDGPAVNFLFFEDKEKFYYKSINELMGKSPVEKYFTTSADRFVADGYTFDPDIEVARPRYLCLTTMEFKGYHDITKSASKGMLGNRMIKWDPFYKRVTDYFPRGPEADNYKLDKPYSYSEDYGKLDHCDDKVELVRSEVSKLFGEENANTVLTVVPDHNFCWDDQEKFETEKFVRQRPGQIEQIEFLKMNATMPGNFTRRVGEKIEIDLYSPEFKYKGPDEEPSPDVRFKGNWLIAKLRRKFTRDRHSLVCELIKDNYYELRTKEIWDWAMPPDSHPTGRE